MTTYETRVTQLSVVPVGETLNSEMCTTVTIVSEAADEFIELEQSGQLAPGKIAIDPDEWPALRDAIDRMVSECKQEG